MRLEVLTIAGRKKCSDCQRIVADRQQSYAAQQYVAAHLNPEGATGIRSGTREEPGTLTQGAPVFPGSFRLGIEPKTPGWLVQDPVTQPPARPIGDLIPTKCVFRPYY